MASEDTAAAETIVEKERFLPYKPILVLHDILIVTVAAAAAVWVVGAGQYIALSAAQKALLFGICLITIAFFPSFNLYSYHLIHSARYHLLNMGKAFCLSLVTLVAIMATYTWPLFLPPRWLIPVLLVFAVVLFVFNRIFSERMIEVLKAFGFACIAVGLAGLIGPPQEMFVLKFWQQLLLAGFLAISTLVVTRYVTVHYVFNVVYRRSFRRQVLVIGSNQEAERVTNHIIRLNAPFWVAGTVDPCGGGEIRTTVPKKVLGRLGDLDAILGKNGIHEAIVTDECIKKTELITIIDMLTTRGISVWFLPRLMPIIDIKLHIDNFCGIPMIRLSSNRYTRIFSILKSVTDWATTLIGFILILPVLAAAAVAIKLDSKGPVFYRPQVVGRNGRLFTMFKFRSMITGASKNIHKDYVTSLIKGDIRPESSNRPLKIVNDPRITRVGNFLRKTSIDELPQLINVLKGDMSLVGPRPCLTYEYEIYKDWHKKRTMVKPGITGLWQVVGRSEVAFDDMILLDLYYIYNRSIELDFNILIETIFVVLRKKGAH